MAKTGVVCGVCGHKHPATPEGWVAPHISKRTRMTCPGGEQNEDAGTQPPPGEPEPPTEQYNERSISVRTISGGLPGLGRRRR